MTQSEKPWSFASVLDWLGGAAFAVFGAANLVHGYGEFNFGSELAASGQQALATVNAEPECHGGGMGGTFCTVDYTFEASGSSVQLSRGPINQAAYKPLTVGTPVQIWYLSTQPSKASTRSPFELRYRGGFQFAWSCFAILAGLLILRRRLKKFRKEQL